MQYLLKPRSSRHHFTHPLPSKLAPASAGLLIIYLAIITAGCNPGKTQRNDTQSPSDMTGLLPGYALSSPDHIARLPKKLKEASDVTAISQNEVAMVQDEKGLIFLFDLRNDKVVRKIKFGPKGDYEGLARLGSDMYVLESSGVLFKVKDWQTGASAVATRLPLPAKDNESLCYDPIGQQLLIAPKSRWKKKKGSTRHKRPVFSVNPTTDKMNPAPSFVLDTRDIVSFARRHSLSLSDRPITKSHNARKLQFMPAAIAVHPATGEIYMVSAHDPMLVSFDRKGHITGLVRLNPTLFMQPEGIAFLPDGTLVIVNESPKKKPGLLLFHWRKP